MGYVVSTQFCNRANIVAPPDESFIGKTLMIRKVNGSESSMLNLTLSGGVSINPSNVSPMCGIGSCVSLVYAGNGVYDAL